MNTSTDAGAATGIVLPAGSPAARPPSPTQTARRSVASELIKLRTLRSQVWLLVAGILFVAVMGPLETIGEVLDDSPAAASPGDPAVASPADAVMLALTGASTGTLLLGVLGVLLVTGEYLPRSVRTTFMLVPRRGVVVAARAVAAGLVVAAASAVAVAAAVTGSFALLAHADVHVGWGSPEVARVAAGAVWYLVGWVVLGQAAGWVTRSKLGGSALLVVVMLVLPPLLGLVPGRAGDLLVALMPSSVGEAMVEPAQSDAIVGPGLGFLLWSAYLLGSMAFSAWLTAKRDA